MRNWGAVDWIVAVLAVALAMMLLLTSLDMFISEERLSEDARRTLAGVVGSVLSIIALYVGSQTQPRNKDKDG